jgi:putative ABC transport system permease protein
MTRAFRLNLTALSLLALVVGMFLIYNTTTFSVIRRRRLIGLLRALGVTRREIFALVLSEALLIGAVGTGTGLLLGMLLGGEMTRLVTRTINDLYFVTAVRSVPMLPGTLLKALLLGIGATLAAAFPPALEATGAPPRAVLSRSHMESRRRKVVPLAALAGVLVVLTGIAILLTGQGGITAGFLGLFLVIIGYALLVPAAMVLLSRLLTPLLRLALGVLGTMAARGVVVSLSRTGVATAALVVAVAAASGVGLMVDSFRLAVAHWLESWLQADVYVTTIGTGTGRGKPSLEPLLVDRLARLPGTVAVSRTRRVTIEAAEGSTDILAMEIPRTTFFKYRFTEGNVPQAWQSFSRGESVLVSEPYAWRHRLHPGGRVTLRTGLGERSFPVAAVFADYGTDAGIVAVARSAYVQLWADPAIDGMGFYAAPGMAAGELARRIRAEVGGANLAVVANQELREASLKVFDRTFAITGVLRILILVVAFVGILAALMALQVERARELATLRAVGLTPGQVWGVVCGETGLIGIIAGLLSLPLGIGQALVLIHVINRRSFGWSMDLALDPLLLLQALALALTAALLAGIYPSLLLSRTTPAVALREEE